MQKNMQKLLKIYKNYIINKCLLKFMLIKYAKKYAKTLKISVKIYAHKLCK
jgi:hypothetical protein